MSPPHAATLPAPEPANAEPLSLLTRAVLALPPLVHYATQSSEAKPTHPLGHDAMDAADWLSAEDQQLLARSEAVDHKMSHVLLPTYLVLWLVTGLIYLL